MDGKRFAALLASMAMCIMCHCVHGDNQQPSMGTTPASVQQQSGGRSADDDSGFNQTEYILACNETFHTSMGESKLDRS